MFPELIFEKIYDEHSAGLYGIILKISQNVQEAEEILLQVFKTYFVQTVPAENNNCIFMHLLRITVSVVSEKTNVSLQHTGRIVLKAINQKNIGVNSSMDSINPDSQLLSKLTTYSQDLLFTSHKQAARHREDILQSDDCGCFYCLTVFKPADISKWRDYNQTALCPHCGIDSVIADKPGYPATDPDFLKQMRTYWF